MSLTVDIEKKLDNFRLQVSFEAGDGVTSILGASGCGKSMTLRCIAGVATPDRGRIVLDGRVLFDSEKGINIPPQKRNTGFLFQNYALFPNMTVRENILTSVRGGHGAAEKRRITDEVIERLHLTDVSDLLSSEISGGQMQRTALARIMVNGAEIILLDEPFSALDEHLRFAVENELYGIMKEFRRPVILVSHSRDEVYRLSDRVAVMNGGIIENSGPVREVFRNPRTVYGARLTGVKNIAPATVEGGRMLHAPAWGISRELPENTDVSGITAAGIRMNDLRAERPDGVSGRIYDFDIVRVTENLFSRTVELRAAGSGNPAPLYWQVAGDGLHYDGRKRISLFVPDDAVMPLRGKI